MRKRMARKARPEKSRRTAATVVGEGAVGGGVEVDLPKPAPTGSRRVLKRLHQRTRDVAEKDDSESRPRATKKKASKATTSKAKAAPKAASKATSKAASKAASKASPKSVAKRGAQSRSKPKASVKKTVRKAAKKVTRSKGKKSE